MKLKVLVKADTNDADYVTKLTSVDKSRVPDVEAIAKAVSEFKPYKVHIEGMDWTHNHNWPDSEYSRSDLGEKTVEQLYVSTGKLTADQVEWFRDSFVPYGEYGIHSIKEIKILKVEDEVSLLK